MPPAARVTDTTTHGSPLAPGPGSVNVLIGNLPAWRAMIDQHACPMVNVSGADGVGSVMMGSPTVLINNQMACRLGDIVIEKPGLAMGPANPIVMGEMTVIIGEVGMGSPSGPSMPGSLTSSAALTPEIGEKKTNAPALMPDGASAVTNSDKYKKCPVAVKNKIRSKEFTENEKKAIDEVLDKYKPLMKCSTLPLKKIGRTDKAITKNGNCVAETNTMGEWFDDSGTLVLTDAASNPVDFKNGEIQFRATAAHEISHALLNNFDPRSCKSYKDSGDNPIMKEFHKAAGWDATGTTLTESKHNKAPTAYAKTNDEEDLSESMMLYIYDPARLKKSSPARYDFCSKLLGRT